MPHGSSPGERRGGRKKGTPNKLPGGTPKKTRKEIMGELIPPNSPSQAKAPPQPPQEWSGWPGDPYDPRYLDITDPIELMLAIAADFRMPVGARLKYASEVAPYVRSRMAVAPYRPPDHDGRVIIEVVEFSEKDFE